MFPLAAVQVVPSLFVVCDFGLGGFEAGEEGLYLCFAVLGLWEYFVEIDRGDIVVSEEEEFFFAQGMVFDVDEEDGWVLLVAVVVEDVFDPADPGEEVRVVAGEADHAEFAFQEGDAHEVNEGIVFLGIVVVVFLGNDVLAVAVVVEAVF